MFRIKCKLLAALVLYVSYGCSSTNNTFVTSNASISGFDTPQNIEWFDRYKYFKIDNKLVVSPSVSTMKLGGECINNVKQHLSFFAYRPIYIRKSSIILVSEKGSINKLRANSLYRGSLDKNLKAVDLPLSDELILMGNTLSKNEIILMESKLKGSMKKIGLGLDSVNRYVLEFEIPDTLSCPEEKYQVSFSYSDEK